MDLSVMVARILAVTYIAAGVGAFLGKQRFSGMIEDFERSAGLTHMAGFTTLIMGMLLVHFHNLWVKDWRMLITIVGWMSVVKGVLLIVYPKYISFFKNCYQHFRLWSILMLAIGLLFGYFGFAG